MFQSRLGVLFLCFFSLACFSILFIADAEAATPRVTWKHTKTSIHKTKQGLELRVFIEFTNKSTDEKVITQLYDKQLYIEGNIVRGWDQGRYGVSPTDRYPFKQTIRSKKVNETDIWPGKSYTLYFSFPVKNVMKIPTLSSSQVLVPDKVSVKKMDFKYKTGSI